MKQHKLTLLIAANAVSFGVVMGLIVLFVLFAPKVETKVWPIIKVHTLDDIYRDHDKVCWSMQLEKLSWAVSPRYEWHLTPPIGPDIALAAYLADEDNNISPDQDLKAHPVGDRWLRRYCAPLGERVADEQGMRLWGFAEHHRHNLWESRTRMPVFTVCPIQGYAVKGCKPQVIY